MNTAHLTSIIEQRWNEAIANPTIPRWRTLAQMAAQVADSLAEHDPNNIMVVTHRAIYQEAYSRMLAMEPKEIAA